MAEWLRMTRMLLAARWRAQLQFRGSFVADLLSQLLLGVVEFVEIYVLLHAAPVYAGMDLGQACVVYGLSAIGFGLADLACGELERVSSLIREGRLEVLLTRPVSVLLQLVTQDFQLRRLGRVTFGVVALGAGLWSAGVPLALRSVALVTSSVVATTGLFTALFVAGAATLFFVLEAGQANNAFTYGGKYVSQAPGAALMSPVRELFTFVVPATLVTYVPAAVLTGAPMPGLWWPGLAWLGIPIVAAVWALVLLYWRAAIRHYTGAGG